MKVDEQLFSSSDFYLSSVLVCLGYELIMLDKSNKQRAIFIFKKTLDLPMTIKDYWNRKLKLEPLVLFESQKYLKNRIYSQ